MPTVTLVTDAFVGLASQLAKAMRHPDLSIVVIEHPLGGIERDEVLKKAQVAAQAVVARLGASA